MTLYDAAYQHALNQGCRPAHARRVATYTVLKANAAAAYYLARNSYQKAKPT